MANAKTALRVRAIFSDALLAQLDCDQPIMTTDRASGLTLAYRFEAHAGGLLTVTGDDLARSVTVGVDGGDINLVATLILDGLKCQ